MDTGLRGWRTWHVLTLLYQQQGRLAEAAALWQAVLAECPDFGSAWQGMEELQVSCPAPVQPSPSWGNLSGRSRPAG